MAAGEEPAVIAITAAAGLRELLTLRDCPFTRADPGTGGGPHHRRRRPDWSGREIWPTADLGPAHPAGADLPVRGGGGLLGHFPLTPTPGRRVPATACMVAVAMADQLGAALAADNGVPPPGHERTVRTMHPMPTTDPRLRGPRD